MTPRLAIKRYQGEHHPHAHDFAQLVLPIQGGMELEVEGRTGARLHTGLAAASAFERLLARVEAQPAGDWSNPVMARLAGVGLSRLHLFFHERFAQTPQAWLTDLRLRQAQRWLGDSRLPIAEIALRVGFSDQAALTRAMTRRQGISPAAWRRNQRTLG